MANNRLYILDTEVGDKFLLCKSLGAWYIHHDDIRERLNQWLYLRDHDGQELGGTTTALQLITEYDERDV
jgi:hypothetical protein